ncbi:MAG: NADH-quinone oxidoreductase subunit J [Legionellales bacterium]|nr:NADH-quinone oxidoreductase subunit J [Legionellales bacterium]
MHEILPQLIFDVFAGMALLSALMVITQNNPVRCVLFLVLTFVCTAVLWLLVQAEFLALILVLVYVGAVMTLFLFVVMMLNIDTESMKKHFTRYLPFGLMGGALLTGLLLMSLPKGGFQMSIATAVTDEALPNTEALGMVLYTDYVFAFELAAVILLVAIIAAITLVHRHPIRSKRQDIVKQIMTRREDRVKLIKMKSEKET